ncbi:MAG: single-stranded DNA-binding protein [Ignavibacteria bacterium]|nr:single-stranded DNA-binding protein [Ignavibacteria bacterium]MBM4174513.1 single-stranded DNA-binding protein [Ignavibacteria bacterium]
MSRALNKVQFIGHVGKDPEYTFTSGGTAVATFRLATSESWKDKNGALQESTDWHTIVVWNSQYRNLADIVHKMVHKGSRIYVEGKLKYRTYESRDGSKRTVTEIIADSIILLDAKPANSESGTQTIPEEHNEE